MAKLKSKPRREGEIVDGLSFQIDVLGEDLLQSILTRLPAQSFAFAACVSRCWNSICSRVLSYPKLSSAVSFNHSVEDAVEEVVTKVFSEPIRPQFALFSYCPTVHFRKAHLLISKKLSSRIPLITTVSRGVFGKDVLTDEFVEVLWRGDEELENNGERSPPEDAILGVELTVGCLPGLKTHIIPLMINNHLKLGRLLSEQFVVDIRDYSLAVSGSASPAGIMLFVRIEENINPVLRMMDYAFSSDTFIVGHSRCFFLHRHDEGNSKIRNPKSCAAVALVFVRDKNKPVGIGETQFDVFVSRGLSAVGPPYKAVSVSCIESSSTLLGVEKSTNHMNLDGRSILEEIRDELRGSARSPVLFIGVTKSRKCSIGTEKIRKQQFLEFHEVAGGNADFLLVGSVDINTRDPFQFYASDSKVALSSTHEVSDNFRCLKQGCDKGKVVFGGIIIACAGRGIFFSEQPSVDRSRFMEYFPGVTFAGTYCSGEIARGNSSIYERVSYRRSCQHFYSSVYLVMSYTPA